jgi:hypothetical protein
MKANLIDLFQSNQKLSNWFLKLLVCLLMACASVSFVQFAQRLTTYNTPNSISNPLNIWYLPILVFAVTIEVFVTREKVESLDIIERTIYHITEWVVIALIVKIVIYLVIGPSQLWTDLSYLARYPASFFIAYDIEGVAIGESEFLPILLLLFLAWIMASDIAKEVDRLQSELTDFKWEMGKLDNDRQDARRRIAEKVFLVGGIMILLSMVTRLNIKGFLGNTLAFQAPLVNVIIFFFLALVLLSQTQFAFLRGRWFWSQTPIAPHVGKNWIRYSLIFFVVIALIALILPTAYTFTLLQLIQAIVNFVAQIGFFIVSLFAYLFGLIASMIGEKGSIVSDNKPIPTPQPPPPPQIVGEPLPWLDLLKSILFWAVFIGIIGFAVVHFIRQNRHLFLGVLKVPGFGWFFKTIKVFWGWLTGASRQISAAIAVGLQRIFQSVPKSITRQMQQFLNFRQLSPRQQVVFYYLKLIERSQKSGVKRMPHQTPNQFAADLDHVIPEVSQEVNELTGSFIEARYSQHPVGAQQTSLVQRLWRKIVKSLRPAKPGNL